MRHLYSLLWYVLCPFLLLRILWRSRYTPAYRERLSQRFGFFVLPAGECAPVIWLHAVSLGEVQTVAPIVRSLLEAYPNHRVLVTTSTPTGSAQLKQLFGEGVLHSYCPWDLPCSVRRFLKRVRPQVLVLVETELWPNLLYHCHMHGCAAVLVNGRMSQRSANGYARVGLLTEQMLSNLDQVACQSAADGQRFLSLGLAPAALTVSGNIKFDAAATRFCDNTVIPLCTGERPVLLAASTHEGEETLLLQAFAELRQTIDQLLLVLVPRHPDRAAAVHTLCLDGGWRVLRRSEYTDPCHHHDIVLVDTSGELSQLYAGATVAFVGGSLVARGGHNFLEAAGSGVPVVTGPSLFNFSEAAILLEEAGAIKVLEGPDDLTSILSALLLDSIERARMGNAGRRAVLKNSGALEHVMKLLADTVEGG